MGINFDFLFTIANQNIFFKFYGIFYKALYDSCGDHLSFELKDSTCDAVYCTDKLFLDVI